MGDAVSAARLQDFDRVAHVLANGIRGEIVALDSHSPLHWADIVSGANGMPVRVWAQLFIPRNASGPVPAVVLVPGSTGINTTHARHAA